jgi:hypothetical protein
LRPFGFVLLLAALRWRTPEGRLLLALAFIPQTALPYELVSLALVPVNLLEMGIYGAGSWITVAAASSVLHLSVGGALLTLTSWPATLGAVYLPMLILVLRRDRTPRARKTERGRWQKKERRRPFRLDDDELRVDVLPNSAGGVTVKVTHLPTKRFATESAETRELAERKAHDKLAGLLARAQRAARPGGEANRRTG